MFRGPRLRNPVHAVPNVLVSWYSRGPPLALSLRISCALSGMIQLVVQIQIQVHEYQLLYCFEIIVTFTLPCLKASCRVDLLSPGFSGVEPPAASVYYLRVTAMGGQGGLFQ